MMIIIKQNMINTYHALYFSALLNKKCILYNMELNETQTLNKELLQNSIKINDIFYSDIISKNN